MTQGDLHSDGGESNPDAIDFAPQQIKKERCRDTHKSAARYLIVAVSSLENFGISTLSSF